jgi:hypothetical protein
MKNTLLLNLIYLIFLSSCGIYGYTDSRSTTKTISVSRIQNTIKTHSPSINYEITSALEKKLSQQVDLKLIDKDADYQISGSITNYEIKPFSIGSRNEVYLNRVTIEISVQLLDQLENYKTTNKKVAVFADYNAKKNFGEIKDSINNLLSEKAADEIYNELFLRW